MKIKNVARRALLAGIGYKAYKKQANPVRSIVLKQVGSKYHIYAQVPHAMPKLIGRYSDLEQAYKAYELLKTAE